MVYPAPHTNQWHPAPSRTYLHSGYSPGHKALIGCLMVPLLLATSLIVVILAALLTSAGPAFALAGGVLGFLFLVCLPALLFLPLFRAAAWMEHTTVVVRGPFRTRRCDLATAHVSIDAVPEMRSAGPNGMAVATGRRIPRLCLVPPGLGKAVQLNLYDPATKSIFEPHKLHLLADAMTAVPRHEPDASRTTTIAQALRAMADDPLINLR